tara:strand:+ start:2904 stop:3491 length:588 start_codon:yes stop_codon:yes gene_type:complete
MINVYCLKWGTKYNREFVERLKYNLSKYLTVDYDFKCLTDKPECDYDLEIDNNLPDVWNKLSLLKFKGDSLYFDLDIDITDNINFLTNDFDYFTVINSRSWKNNAEDLKFKITCNTFVNSSIMRWSNHYDIYYNFIKNSNTFIRLYKGIDRYIYNEKIDYKYFSNDNIISWKSDNFINKAIVLYNGRYKNKHSFH